VEGSHDDEAANHEEGVMHDIEKYNRAAWMTDDQWECARMLADLFYGFHHIMGTIKPCGSGIEINSRNGTWSTFDFDGLTRAVVLAHDRMIRFEIDRSGPGLLKIMLHKRHSREGRMQERHPALEEAIFRIRGSAGKKDAA
jgi:hypothetical protein